MTEEEEGVSLEDVVGDLYSQLEQLQQAYTELWLDNQALLGTLRTTTGFNEEYFQYIRQGLVRGFTQ